MTFRKLIRVVVLLCLAGGAAAARAVLNPTVTPTSHDFGDNVVGVGGNWFAFNVTVPAGGGHTDSLRVFITGPDAADFKVDRTAGIVHGATPAHLRPDCQNTRGSATLAAGTCVIDIEFNPTTIGRKTATLRVVDKIGMTSATLTGDGVYGCRMVVVPCNYAMLYSGTFSWFSKLSSAASSWVDSGTVTVSHGKAACRGVAISTDPGRTRAGSIAGTGVFAVEFLEDPLYPLVYLITVACPTPAFPATADEPADPSRPAELGQGELLSEKQPARDIGIDLHGTISYPSPDTDPLNGVTGHVTISWNLKGTPAPAGWRRPRP